MGKNNKNKSRKRKHKKANTKQAEPFVWKFLPEAGPGCYIARRDMPNIPDWMLEWEDIPKDEFEEEEIPDVALDPDEKTLSVCNASPTVTKIAYVAVYETPLRGRDGKLLALGSTTNPEGVTRPCITFIVLCPPLVFCHLCYVENETTTTDDWFDHVSIESDVQEWNQHKNPNDQHSQTIGFPLEGRGPFLCTQSEGGQLTHYFAGNLHAIDFRCPVGTPLLAVADGTIVESKDENSLTGIAVTNLFQWNSIILHVESTDPLFVEYVHIQKSIVKAGDHVQKGQVIGYSGSVGFSPEPHLHFSAFRSEDTLAATVRVLFEATGQNSLEGTATTTFLPQAGLWYNGEGLQEPE